MRNHFAIALACAALAGCNTTMLAPTTLAPLAGSVAGALAMPACADIAKTSAAATQCLNAARAVITLGEALAGRGN